LLAAWALATGKVPSAAISAWFLIALLYASFLAWREEYGVSIKWSRVTPSMPQAAAAHQVICTVRGEPIYSFELAVGDVQEIQFEGPIKITLHGVLHAAAGGTDYYAADVDIDASGQFINHRCKGAWVQKLSYTRFRIAQRPNQFSDGFTVFLAQHSDRNFKAFSLAVDRTSPERGTALFTALCTSWNRD